MTSPTRISDVAPPLKNPLRPPRTRPAVKKKESGSTWLRKFISDPGVYFTQNPMGVVLFLIMGVLLLNMVIVLILMILAPLSEFPSHSGEEVGFFGVSILLGGWFTTLLHITLVGFIVFPLYRVMIQDGPELVKLLKVELSGNYEDLQRTSDMAKNHRILLKQPKQIPGNHHEEPGRSLFSPQSENTFVLICLLTLALLAYNAVVNYLFLHVGGIVPQNAFSTSGDPFHEVLFRLPQDILFNGVFFLVFLIGFQLYLAEHYGRKVMKNECVPGLQGFRNHIMNFLGKDDRRYSRGGGIELNALTLLLIIFSASVFSFFHATWYWLSLVLSFPLGCAFGYLYVKKGIHASILLYLMFTTIDLPVSAFGEMALVDITWTMIQIGALTFGVYYLVAYLILFLKYLQTRRPLRKREHCVRSISAFGGTVALLLFVLGIYAIVDLFLGDYGDEEHVLIHEELEAGDYRIYTIAAFEEPSEVKGSINLSGMKGDIEYYLGDEGTMDRWKEREGDEPAHHFERYQRVTVRGEHGSNHEVCNFSFSMKSDEIKYILIHALENSSAAIRYHMVSEENYNGAKAFGVACVLPYLLILAGCGIIEMARSRPIEYPKPAEEGDNNWIEHYWTREAPPPSPPRLLREWR